jgi:hypothetical protein
MPDENQGWKQLPPLDEDTHGSEFDKTVELNIQHRRGGRQLRRAPDGALRGLKNSGLHNHELQYENRHASQSPEHGGAAPAAVKPARWRVAVSGFLSRFGPGKPLRYLSMALFVLALVAVSVFKPIDHSSESQLDSALTRALIGFGIARTLNGVISVAQGTEFAVQPAGVGVNFSPGEILDPVNDLVERFSWVMLFATSSLGIQKILLEVSSWSGISFMLAGAGLFWLLTRWRSGTASQLASIASRLLLLVLLIRFLIPVGSLANDWVYRQFLEPKFEASSQQLEEAGDRIREINSRNTEPPAEADSLREKAKNLYQSVTSKFDFDGMLDDYKASAETVTEHAVNLIVVFLLQTVIFPLLFLYLVYRLFRMLLLPAVPAR